MNGQMMNSNEKDRIAKDFINQTNPYSGAPALGIDLRALSKYAKENNIDLSKLSQEDMRKIAPVFVVA